MKINKEGYKIIGITGLICLLLGTGIYRLLSSHDNGTLVWVLVVLMLLFWFFIVAFFREPRRVKIHDADLVFSPCDGRVVVTEPVHESEYLDREMMQISIFMSITNVHMNWLPVGGVVEYFKYHPGRFLVAWHPKSSTENERTTTVVRLDDGRHVLFRQIAGLIARRIVSYMKVGERVKQNDVCGFIKFGSRIDVLLPKDSEVLVEIGDPVVGSQTPIETADEIERRIRRRRPVSLPRPCNGAGGIRRTRSAGRSEPDDSARRDKLNERTCCLRLPHSHATPSAC